MIREQVSQLDSRPVRYLEAGAGWPLVLLHAVPAGRDWRAVHGRPCHVRALPDRARAFSAMILTHTRATADTTEAREARDRMSDFSEAVLNFPQAPL